jgi:hypothetical protein
MQDRLEHWRGLSHFIAPRFRTRFSESLENDRLLRKLRASFSHYEDHLLGDYIEVMPGGPERIEHVHRRLLEAGAPETCVTLSDEPELDAGERPVLEALHALMWSGAGFVSCLPSRLALYVGEDGSTVYLLRRS